MRATYAALNPQRRRLAGSVALEGALLALAGVLLSVPVSLILFDGVRAFELPGRVSIDLLELSLDMSTLAAAGAAGLGATLVMALIAGAFAFPGNAADALRSRGGASPRVVRRRTRSGLVAAQVAVALILVAGATLFTRSLLQALDLNPGIQTDQVVTASFSPGGHGYQPARAAQYFENIRQRLIKHPSIAAIGFYRHTGTSPGQNAIVDGVYVLAESMAIARQKEMSIRAALGASRSHLGSLVLRETTKLVGVGLVAGLGLAWLGAGTIDALLFQIEPLDVPTLTAISAFLLVLALAVSLRPAIAAARVDLASVLRDI